MKTNVRIERGYLRNKLGFTLIELLAVIVILAIIAAIAIPIVINIISSTKTSSQEKSVEMYIKAVELSIANNVVNTEGNTSGTYKIKDNGKNIIKIEEEKEIGNLIKVEYKGTGLTEGTIEIKKGKVTKLRGTKINGKYAAKVYDKIEFFDELPEATLVTGREFNGRIKSIVSGEVKTFTDTDENVKSIEFFSYGRLPEEYTKEELLKLEQVDVSDKQDKSILALHDGNGNVFIYSDKLIFFNVSSSNMFYYFKKIETIKFNLIDTNKTTSMSYMFSGSGLISLDVSSFDTRNVETMNYMFSGCVRLTLLDLSSFNTSNLSSMMGMFSGSGLTKLNVSSFDTSKVTGMSNAFSGCVKITSLDLTSFDTSKVPRMVNMFRNSSNLTLIEVSDKWVIGENTDVSYMFDGCGTNTVTIKQ